MSALEVAVLQRTSAEVAPSFSKSVHKLRGYRLSGEGSAFGLSVLSMTVLSMLWWVATTFHWVPPLFLPSPQAVGCALIDAWHGDIQGSQPLTACLGWSASCVFGAFVLAAVTAIPIGLVMGVSRTVCGLLDPPTEFYYLLPPLAYLPLIVIWLGINERTKTAVIYLACFAPIVMVACVGVHSATLERINAVYALGVGFTQVVRHVILPAALPEILTGLRIVTGFDWTTFAAAEVVAAAVGVGQMVLNASSFLRTDLAAMGIVLIGAIAWAFDLAMRATETRVVPQKDRSQPQLRSCL